MEKPRRRLWQFHLSTAVVMMLVAGAMLPLAVSRFPRDPQKYAKDAEWNLDGTVGDIQSSAAQNKSAYTVSVSKKSSGFFMESDLVIKDAALGEVAKLSVRSGERTPFLVVDDVFYFADYGPITSGCTLVAFDLKKQREKWRTHLMGIGPVEHSKYRNQVNLKLHDDVVVVYGNESAGKYVELVDSKNGQTWANKGYSPTGNWKKIPGETQVLTFYNIPRTDVSGIALSIGAILGAAICCGVACEIFIRRNGRKGTQELNAAGTGDGQRAGGGVGTEIQRARNQVDDGEV